MASNKNIVRLANGKYQVRKSKRVRGELVTKKCSTCRTKGEAMAKLLEFTAELDSLAEKYRDGVVLWGEALDEFERYSVENHSSSTSYNQVKALKQHTLQWIDVPLADLLKEKIKVHIEDRLGGASASTKNCLAKYIRNVIRVQQDKGRIQYNPAQGLRFNHGGKKYNELTAMTRQEIEKLFEFTKEIEHEWHSVYRVTYGLGLRSGEAYALKWSHLDFDLRRATIVDAYCRRSDAIGPPKNRKPRIVPVSRGLNQYLMELGSSNIDSEFVLPRLPSWKHGDASKILRSLQDHLGIQRTNFHSLRASFITHLLNAGVPMVKVQEMVGHADLKTTQRYVRLSGSDLDGATDALDS